MKRFVLLIALSACGKHAETTTSNSDGCTSGTGVCVAFAANFTSFHAWKSYDVTDAGKPDAIQSGAVHTGATLTAYINKVPPHGSKEFPIGTIIVKEPTGGDPTQAHTFAGVKRGGDYDSEGATNWEWFELMDSGTPTPVILWRGVGPPVGEVYGGNPAACNGCHQGAAANDFIWADELQLSNF